MEIIERNLQELGKSLFVSLPKEWITAFKLKKGSSVKIINSGNGILSIAPEFQVSKEKKESIINYDKNFNRMFFREYFFGNEKITINFNNISKEQRKELYSFLKRFINVQIIEDSVEKIIVKSFRIEELSMEECLKRLYFLSLGMFEELSAENNKMIKTETRDNMTRFYYILVMQIRRYLEEGKFTENNQITLIRAMDYRMVAEKMQRISEIILNIDKLNKEFKYFSIDLNECYSKVVLSFINNNFKNAPENWEFSEKVYEKNKRLLKLKNLDNEDYKIILDLFQILRYIKEISGLIR